METSNVSYISNLRPESFDFCIKWFCRGICKTVPGNVFYASSYVYFDLLYFILWEVAAFNEVTSITFLEDVPAKIATTEQALSLADLWVIRV